MANPSLGLEEFDVFFAELHGTQARPVAAYHWQRQLVEQVLGHQGWPGCIDLPTGAGKTAVLDIAVFTLAADDTRPRRAPLRCFFVVDRRVVVDEAYRRARHIADRLRGAQSGVLARVAARLRERFHVEDPVSVAALRGGIYREDNWARTPAQPLIVVSTVDQLGSRLLGRGYGVSDRMAPVHMGLVAEDALIILDEAHLSAPFEETLVAVERYRSWCERSLPTPWCFLRMSATLPRSLADDEGCFRLPDSDLTDGRLGRVLRARKRARLVAVDLGSPPKKDDSRERQREWARSRPDRDLKFASRVCQGVMQHLDSGARALGVIVNTVAVARKVWTEIGRSEPLGKVPLYLLTGRSRPLDRDRLVETVAPRLQAGRKRTEGDEPIIVVATQCLEAGADLDFDALVTECSSLDALKQRFGRLDRLGILGESRATISFRQSEYAKEGDPVYGASAIETWRWLNEEAASGRKRGQKKETPLEIGFGTEELPKPNGERLKQMLPLRKTAPTLLPACLDAWIQTSPRPAAEPEVALWLHGRPDEAADVQIVWRADLDSACPETWSDVVALCPPASAEALAVPVYAVRAWLAQKTPEDVADVVMAGDGRTEAAADPEKPRKALRWRGEDSEIIDPDDIRPGDTMVVPSVYGGCDKFGWNPEWTDPVSDLGDEAQWRQRGRPFLRVHSKLVDRWTALAQPKAAVPPVPAAGVNSEEEGERAARERIEEFLRQLAARDGLQPWVRGAARQLMKVPWDWWPYPEGEWTGFVVRARRRVPVDPAHATEGSQPDFTSEDDSSSFTRPVRLDRHCAGVGNLARTLALTVGVDEDIACDMRLAGLLHDVGKSDPRFQAWLHGGDEAAAALADAPLAKSGIQDPAVRRAARRRAGYPEGARHELLSLAMMEHSPILDSAEDRDLVLHLVASHHGYCRPFAPVVTEKRRVHATCEVADVVLEGWSDAPLGRLDSGVSDRFFRLVRRYGWFGLSYLEALFRLADHRCSHLEEMGTEVEG